MLWSHDRGHERLDPAVGGERLTRRWERARPLEEAGRLRCRWSDRSVASSVHDAAQLVSEVARLRLPHRSVLGEDDSSGVEGL